MRAGAGRPQDVSTELVVFESLLHAFWTYLIAPESDEAFAIMAAPFKAKMNANAEYRRGIP